MNDFITYEQAMAMTYNGLHPNEVHGVSNANTWYQARYLYTKLYSKFDIHLPEGWDLNTFRLWLFRWGTLGIFKDRDGEWFFAPYGIEKMNRYLNPSRIRAYSYSDELNYDNVVGTVGEDCFIIKCFDDYRGWNDLITDTAESLSCIDKAVKVASMNANVNLVGFAENKKEALELQNAYSEATQGKPLVLINSKFLTWIKQGIISHILQPFTNHDTVGAMDKLLVGRRGVMNNFLTEIGIKNANISKKERLNTEEVEANDEEVSAIVTVCYENIKAGLELFSKKTGVEISIDLRNDYKSIDDITVVEGGDLNA